MEKMGYKIEPADFPKWVKMMRNHVGLTQKELDEVSDSGREYTKKLESGFIKSTRLESAERLADALGYDLKIVLTRR